MNSLENLNIDGILLINLSKYWYRTSTSYNEVTGAYYQNSEPNASYVFYLIDARTLKPVCMGVSNINGNWAGYNTLNNKFSRMLARKLYYEWYIYLPPEKI